MSRTRFPVGGLYVAPSIVGAVHRFQFDGASVEVQLPQRPKLSKPRQFDPEADVRPVRWRGGRVLSFEVTQVTIFIDTGKRAHVPFNAVGTVKFSLFRPSEQKRLTRIADAAQHTALQVLDRWLRTLRWRSSIAAIGQRDIGGHHLGRSTYLVDAHTRERFISNPTVFVVPGSATVSRAAWTSTARFLMRGIDPPPWFDFLFEGQHRVRSRDLHSGVVCLAVACESVVRALLRQRHLKRPVNPKFSAMVDFLSIKTIIDDWKSLGFWDAQWEQATDIPKLRRLFELRNDVVHRAKHSLDEPECRALVTAVRAFVLHAARPADRTYT